MKCNIKNISINYEVFGEGKPIIMLHGYYVDHRIMSGCMEPIFNNVDKFKRIYIDLPGMGKSDCADWIMSSDDILNILIEFINKIIGNEKFLIVGESYGCYLTRGLIYKMPNRIDGIALICPLIIPDYNKRNVEEHIVIDKDDELLIKLSSEEAEDFSASFVCQNQKIYERYKNEVISGIKLANDEFLQNIMQNAYEFSFNVDDLKEKFNKPAIILLGKQDDCVGYKDAWSILENFPRASFAILDKAGHNLQIEQEDVFNSLISEWIKRVDVS